MTSDRRAFAKFRALALARNKKALCLALFGLGLGFCATAQAQMISTFDAPGAGTAFDQGTFAFSINPAGTIVGFTRDVNWVRHAFLRGSDGSFTIFDAPGAGTCSTPCADLQPGTRAYSINPAGTITGFYSGNSFVHHGYVRTGDGTFTSFDPPDAGTGFGQGTYPDSPAGINPAGAITGYYVDGSGGQHGFLRDPDGTIIEFDPTGSIYTQPAAINSAGAITGFYIDGSGMFHGFLRGPDGTITPFDVPGDADGIFPWGFLPTGAIEGGYIDASFVSHGFLGPAGGPFTTFDVPVAGTGIGQGTSAFLSCGWGCSNGNNTSGAIVGNYLDASYVNHGFLRSKRGAFTTFDAPGAGTGAFQGTIPSGINPPGAITGYDIDANGVIHGFLRTK